LIFDGENWVIWTGFIWFRILTSGGSFENDNETLGSIKYLEID
jgi:hypothetical protein